MSQSIQPGIKPNNYELSKGFQVRITYQVQGIDGQPRLNYRVFQGPPTRTFTSDQIRLQETEIGTQVSVTLEAIPDDYTTTLTLLLPNINLPGPTGQVFFEAPVIWTTHRDTIGGPGLVKGAVESYEVLVLNGSAWAIQV